MPTGQSLEEILIYGKETSETKVAMLRRYKQLAQSVAHKYKRSCTFCIFMPKQLHLQTILFNV